MWQKKENGISPSVTEKNLLTQSQFGHLGHRVDELNALPPLWSK